MRSLTLTPGAAAVLVSAPALFRLRISCGKQAAALLGISKTTRCATMVRCLSVCLCVSLSLCVRDEVQILALCHSINFIMESCTTKKM
jgi:hypothetical protein